MKITMENYEGWLMRYADNQLNASDRREAETFLSEHPELQEELALLSDSSLKITAPDTAYPYKEALLHEEVHRIVPPWRRPLSIAASAALLIGVGCAMLFSRHDKDAGLQVAENHAVSMTDASSVPQHDYGITASAKTNLSTTAISGNHAQSAHIAPTHKEAVPTADGEDSLTATGVGNDDALLAESVTPSALEETNEDTSSEGQAQTETAEAKRHAVQRSVGIVVDNARLASTALQQILAAK